MQLSEQEVVRREKLVKLRALGINPYPADLFPIDSDSTKIKEDYSEGKKVVIAGRLMSINVQGKASFAQLQDGEGRVQVYFNRDVLCEGEDKTLYNDVFKKLLDIGDFIGNIYALLFAAPVGMGILWRLYNELTERYVEQEGDDKIDTLFKVSLIGGGVIAALILVAVIL